MPTASPELRDAMERRFGDSVGDSGPMGFLKDRGYKLGRDWCWRRPTPDHLAADDEIECIEFLFEEWDFGGITERPLEK